MATVDQLVRDLLGSIATDAAGTIAVRWVNDRYVQLVQSARFRHLRKVREIQVPARINTGAVTSTRDSTTVTPNAAAIVALDAAVGTLTSSDLGEYFIRVANAWYEVASYDGATIVLSTAYSEDDAAASSYDFVKRNIRLDSNVRWISAGPMLLTRLRLSLPVVSLTVLNTRFPGRQLSGSYPRVVAQAENAADDGSLMFEVYPSPAESEIITYIAWNIPASLSLGSTIPPQIDAFSLKEGALIDLYRYEKAKAIRSGNIEAAAIWRNDEMVQETRWSRLMDDAKATDAGEDDISMLLAFNGFGSRGGTSFDNPVTAHDIVANRWPGI